MKQITREDLEKKYLQIPQEMKRTNRWVCYKIEYDAETNEPRKVPMNAMTGGYAKSSDSLTWTSFNVAILGCIKYGFYGLGFMLGLDTKNNVNYFGIDLDNHEDKKTGEKQLSEEEFYNLSKEFVNALDSYTEYSHSGNGVHIICKGNLPEGARRRAGCPVEMYDKGRFFTMTGNIINNSPVNERTEQIKPLWEKYLNSVDEKQNDFNRQEDYITIGDFTYNPVTMIEVGSNNLEDDEIINKIRASKNGQNFIALFNGDMSAYNNDHSAADMAMCDILAFWTGCNMQQMDRIFRKSGLIRKKWDEKRGQETYGHLVMTRAMKSQRDVYVPPKKTIVIETENKHIDNLEVKQKPITQIAEEKMIDEKGDPIFNIKTIFKHYSLTDTGNAERFYDYFGENFRFNNSSGVFMYWNGKNWIVDEKNFIKKFADKMIDILKLEIDQTEEKVKDLIKSEDTTQEEVKMQQNILKGMIDNMKRVSNKAGKDAMISEFQHLHDIPTTEDEYDTYGNFLNTESGVVDLDTSEILPFNRKYMLSKNTKCKVSFEEPVTWIKFLNDIFERRGRPEETEEIVHCIQKALGYCLTDSVKEQCMFILHGDGSNGKSTFIEQVCRVLGDYAITADSELLIQNKNSTGQSTQFSLASLKGARLISTSETDEGKALAEARIKKMTGDDMIRAQYKFGKEFSYKTTYKIWMATNPKPIIRGTDHGIWRRVFYVPFENIFTEEKKDKNMPEKLRKETAQILGWMIKGYQMYKEEGLTKPKCLEEALSDYKNQMNVINAYIKSECSDFPGFETPARQLYQDYKNWAKDNTEYCMSEGKFKEEMVKKGYKRVRKAAGWFYIGIRLNSDKKGIIFGD